MLHVLLDALYCLPMLSRVRYCHRSCRDSGVRWVYPVFGREKSTTYSRALSVSISRYPRLAPLGQTVRDEAEALADWN
jgi:hypothetical protein